MKSWGRFVTIFFAYGIALLHTVVPHHHAQTRVDESVISHYGCIFSESSSGLLQKVLSTDLGVGHLETFKKGGDADIKFSATVVALVATAASDVAFLGPAKTAAEFSRGYIEKLKRKLFLFSVSHFRAPPVC